MFAVQYHCPSIEVGFPFGVAAQHFIAHEWPSRVYFEEIGLAVMSKSVPNLASPGHRVNSSVRAGARR